MGRYPPVQRVTPRLVRFFGFGLWARFHQAWGNVFLAASTLPFVQRCAGSLGRLSRAMGCPGGIYVPVFLGKVPESGAEEGWSPE
jgi:hypothetical protein